MGISKFILILYFSCSYGYDSCDNKDMDMPWEIRSEYPGDIEDCERAGRQFSRTFESKNSRIKGVKVTYRCRRG